MNLHTYLFNVSAFSKTILVSAFAAWFITFGSKIFAFRLGIIAKKSGRRRHEKDTPLLGGLAFYLVLAGCTLAQILFKEFEIVSALNIKSAYSFLIAITLIFGIGILDDWIELKALPKFAIQITAASLVVLSEPALPPILQQLSLPFWLGVPVAVFCIVGITNAMNMIDGLDGLCAGLGAIAAMALVGVILAGDPTPGFMVYILLALAGASVGFLFHNFNPATIFLGDSGSLLIGFTIATAAMRLNIQKPFWVATSIPILLLGLPILDVAFSILRRTRLDRSVFQGDRSHIHHRLQQVGISHRSVVLVLWICSAYLGAVSVFLARVPIAQSYYIYASVIPTLLFWVIALYFIEHRLSYQTAKFSHLFLRQEDLKLRDRHRLVQYLNAQVELNLSRDQPFTVVMIDSSDFIKELANERPHRMVAFYMNIYEILKNRLRETDLISRVSDHRFIAVLAGAGEHDGSDLSVIAYLSEHVKALQENYQVFQSHPHRPEGFRVFQYPKDAIRIWQTLDFSSRELKNITEGQAARLLRKAS